MPTANPRIVSRAEWGANPLNTPAGTIATPTPDLWLHHTASTGLQGASGMRSLQSNAIRGGYVDLEYSLCVDLSGAIFMSRGPGRNTAATGGSTSGVANNARSHAICAMGNFEGLQQPTDALLDSIASCVLWLHAQRAIASPRITGPHRAAPGNATACCGNLLIARIGDINAMCSGAPAPGPTPPPAQESGAVELVTHPSGKGYWIVDSTGAVFAFGAAPYKGGANTLNGGKGPNQPIVGMSCTPSGNGYWLLGKDGGIFSYGDAGFYGAATGHVH